MKMMTPPPGVRISDSMQRNPGSSRSLIFDSSNALAEYFSVDWYSRMPTQRDPGLAMHCCKTNWAA